MEKQNQTKAKVEFPGAQAERERQTQIGEGFLNYSADVVKEGESIDISAADYLLQVGSSMIGSMDKVFGTEQPEHITAKTQPKPHKIKEKEAKRPPKVKIVSNKSSKPIKTKADNSTSLVAT